MGCRRCGSGVGGPPGSRPGGFLAHRKQPGAEDGTCRELGHRGLVVGAMLVPGDWLWGRCLTSWGCLWGFGGCLCGGAMLSPTGLFVGRLGAARGRCSDVLSIRGAALLAPQGSGGNAGSRAARFPPRQPPAPQLEERSTQLPSRLSPPGFAALPARRSAGEAGAGARRPNLLRLVLFQQDFLVPVVPGGATLGWAGPRRAGLGDGQRGRTSAGRWAWARGGLLATGRWGRAPAGRRCSRGRGEAAPSSPTGEVTPLAGDWAAACEGPQQPPASWDAALSSLLLARATGRAAGAGGLASPQARGPSSRRRSRGEEPLPGTGHGGAPRGQRWQHRGSPVPGGFGAGSPAGPGTRRGGSGELSPALGPLRCAACWLPPLISAQRQGPGGAYPHPTLALPAGMVPAASRGAPLPPPAMPAAALRLLCGALVPVVAALCADPLPRVAFPSGEFGNMAGTGTGTGTGSKPGGCGDSSGSGGRRCPGLSAQHRGCVGCLSCCPPSRCPPPASRRVGAPGGRPQSWGRELVAAGGCRGLRGRRSGGCNGAGWHLQPFGSGSWWRPRVPAAAGGLGTHRAALGGGESRHLGGTGLRGLPPCPAERQVAGKGLWRSRGTRPVGRRGLRPPGRAVSLPSPLLPLPHAATPRIAKPLFFLVSVAGGRANKNPAAPRLEGTVGACNTPPGWHHGGFNSPPGWHRGAVRPLHGALPHGPAPQQCGPRF